MRRNLYFWIACDVISVGLYIYKGLGVTALQYLIFLILAISAHFEWVRLYREQQTAQAHPGNTSTTKPA